MKKPKKKSTSGKNQAFMRKLGAPARAWALMDEAAKSVGKPWSVWARSELARAVARQARLDTNETVSLFAEITKSTE